MLRQSARLLKGPASSHVKKSYGIACCRRTSTGIETLLIHKRVSFCFVEFVNGRYRRGDKARIHFLLSGMTGEEKIDVWSLDFARMWFRIWLVDIDNVHTEKDHYEKYRSRRAYFKECHMYDGGKALQKSLSITKCSNTIWELPKGRPNSPHELPLNCAIREFQEETGFTPADYDLILSEPTLCTIIHADNIKYISNYYVAIMKPEAANRPLQINYSNGAARHQIAEVINIQWTAIADIDKLVTPQLWAAIKVLAYKMKKRKMPIKNEVPRILYSDVGRYETSSIC